MDSPEPPPVDEPRSPSPPPHVALAAGLRGAPASVLDVVLRALGAGLWTAAALFALVSLLFPDVARPIRWVVVQGMAAAAALWVAAHGMAALRRAALPDPAARRPLASSLGWTLVVLLAGAGFWLLGHYVVGAV